MTELRDTALPVSQCPFCGHRFDAAMAADPRTPDAVPKPGDVSVCIKCASVLVFADDLTTRAPLPGEIEMTPALRVAQAAVRSVNRRKMRNR